MKGVGCGRERTPVDAVGLRTSGSGREQGIAATASVGRGGAIGRLNPEGALDPTFNGGAPRPIAFGTAILAEAALSYRTDADDRVAAHAAIVLGRVDLSKVSVC